MKPVHLWDEGGPKVVRVCEEFVAAGMDTEGITTLYTK